MTRERVHPPAPTFVDVATPFTALLHEVRPDLPVSVCASLVVERLDELADYVLDLAWARDRQRLYPDAVKAAHASHTGRYAASTPRTLEDIGADHMARSRPHLEIVK